MNSDRRRTPDHLNPSSIRTMFNAIAPTYDLLNHLLSFGLDFRWRKCAVKLFPGTPGGRYLDIAAGSGDVTLELLSCNPASVVAADFAEQMLHVFQRKIGAHTSPPPIGLICCDALTLPFPEQSFDGTIVAFGIRNFADRLRGLEEMRRVLKPSGISVILELSVPTGPMMSRCYRFYSGIILPLLGKIVSSHNEAYAYLPSSISSFPEPAEFLGLMRQAGFADVASLRLSHGVATIYSGRRP